MANVGARAFLRKLYTSRAGANSRKILQRLWSHLSSDDVLSLSAQMSFYFVLSMFPFFILIAGVADALAFTRAWNSLIAWFILYLPTQIRRLVFQTLVGLTGAQNQFLTLGLVGTVWTATGGIMSLMSALNIIYKVKETRSYLRRVLYSCFILIILTAIFIGLFASLTMGDAADVKLGRALHSPHSLAWLWHIGRWILSFALSALAVAVIDNLLPNHKRLWRWITPGAYFTVAAWIAADEAFNFYLTQFGDYQRRYGVFGTFIVLMLWIYVMGLLVLVGAEINSLIRHWKAIPGGNTSEAEG